VVVGGGGNRKEKRENSVGRHPEAALSSTRTYNKIMYVDTHPSGLCERTIFRSRTDE